MRENLDGAVATPGLRLPRHEALTVTGPSLSFMNGRSAHFEATRSALCLSLTTKTRVPKTVTIRVTVLGRASGTARDDWCFRRVTRGLNPRVAGSIPALGT